MSSRISMNERPAKERAGDFGQVNTGYTSPQALSEAKRCLQCKNPTCIKGCPVEINIPGFIKAITDKNMPDAVKILKDKNNLPAVCGRVCPQEEQCELNCILHKKNIPVAIGHLERFVADWDKENSKQPVPEPSRSKDKVAVIGSGPAGLACAADLARKGFGVTVFESLHEPGGVLRYGIPSFRLPREVLDYEINYLKNLGVHIQLNCLIGRTKTIDDLFSEGFKAVFIGTGAGLPKFLNVQGENLNHIYSANEFLVRVNLMHSNEFPAYDTPIFVGSSVAVVGGGNTAMDAARTALRLGAKIVSLVYRRSEEEMPARMEEIRHAKEEGINFLTLANPVRFTSDGKGFLNGMDCVKMELGAADSSGRRSSKKIDGSEFVLNIDMAIIAIGLDPNPVLPSLTDKLETDGKGHLKINDQFLTTIPGVFAGGDIVGGETVIQAMGMGKRAAKHIAEHLKQQLR